MAHLEKKCVESTNLAFYINADPNLDLFRREIRHITHEFNVYIYFSISNLPLLILKICKMYFEKVPAKASYKSYR
jgi:hypothetical protein